MPHSAAGTKTQLLHFDSIYATYLTDSNSATGNVSTPYRAQFFLNQTFRRIKRASLKSVEIPVGFSNVRNGSTATLSMRVNGTAYSVQLAEKNYTLIGTLITDLNTACTGLVSGVTLVFGLTGSLSTPLRMQITTTGVSSFSIIDTNLSKYILGFRGDRDSFSSSQYKASVSNYNLFADNYILLYIPTLNGMNASMMGGLQSTFKIPLNSITNQVYYYFEGSSFPQGVDVQDPNMVLTNLVVYVLDRFGNSLSPNGLDYSFTLELELDV